MTLRGVILAALAVLALAALGSCSGSGLTIHLTWHGVWRVAKYVLAFGAGFATCFVWIYAAIVRAIGSGLGW